MKIWSVHPFGAFV